jgi:hypothetical protein
MARTGYEVPPPRLEEANGNASAAVESPEWWLTRLHQELTERKPSLKKFGRYYDGEHPLMFASAKFRQAFGGYFDTFSDNWCQLVPDAVEERLNVEGFRFPAEGDEAGKGDQDAWRIWQANDLDAGSQQAHLAALIDGCSYALVWPENGGEPIITPESAEQVIVAYRPGTHRRAAALKEWWDDWTGYVNATVYLPDGVYKYRSTQPVKSESDLGQATTIRWVKREVQGERWPLPNPFPGGLIPIVALENRPRLLRAGVSEINGVIPIQNAVNKLCADLMVASEYQSFRQRYAVGIELETDPETGQKIEPFKAGVDRLWTSDNPETKFGEFAPFDLSVFVGAVEMFIQHIASQTRTPPHYFFLRGQFPSGESIKSAETGLVAKALRKMRHFGEAWEEIIRLAFAVKGDPRADAVDAETVWADPESRSEAQHIDAVVKKMAIGVPLPQLWEDAGYSLQQIERFKAMAEENPVFIQVVPPPKAPLPPSPQGDANADQ